jgi:hypothetical protein
VNPYAQAAQDTLTTAGAGANDVASIYGGAQRGGAQGTLQSLYGASKLYGLLGGSGAQAVAPYTGMLGSGLGALQGIQQGGVGGYGQAALDTARLGLQGATQSGLMSAAGASPYASALGYAAIPLELYNFGKNWQSGNTGADALSGAETGAAVGSVVPGVGTLIGGLAGGLLGAASSAFGGGRPDPETGILNDVQGQYTSAYNQNPDAAQAGLSNLSPAQSYQLLAGAMDAKNNTAGHAQPIEQTFGRMGENNLLSSMANEVNAAYNSGQIAPGESAQRVYNSVVTPWLQSETGGQGLTGGASGQGGLLGGSLENMLSGWMGGNLTNQTVLGLKGQTDPYLEAYSGASGLPSQALIRGTPYGGAAVGAYDTYNPQSGAGVASYNAAKAAQPYATGGHMRRRKMHFDDGGSYGGLGSLDLGLTDPNSGSSAWDTSNIFGDSSSDPYGSSYFNNLGSGFDSNGTSQYALDNTGASGSSGAGWLGALNSYLGSGMKDISGLAALGTLANGLFGSGSHPSMPTAPAQYQGVQTINTPSYAMQPNPYYQSMSPAQWLHYGETPNEPEFYQNNELPATSMSSPNIQQQQAANPYQQAQGVYGTPQSNLASALQMYGGSPYTSPKVMAAGGGFDDQAYQNHYVPFPPSAYHVRGPGDGTSDDINAKLSDGEYVIDAPTVSLLGNGSNEAGARKLDQFRHAVRRHAGKKLVRGRQPMHAREPMQYLKGGAA